MGTWNIINLSEIRPDRNDAEYFRNDYQAIIKKLMSSGKTITLGKLFKKIDRGDKAEYTQIGTIPVLRSVNVRGLGFNETRQEYVSDDYFSRKVRGHVLKDDIIITSTGTGTLGRTSIWYKTSKAFNVPENSFLRSPINVDPYLIAAFLNTEFGIQQLFQHQRGSSGQLHLYPIDIKRVVIPECLFPYQTEIGDRLREAFKLQEKSQQLYQQAIDLLENEIGLDDSDLNSLPNKYISNFNEIILGKRLDPEYFNPRAKTIVDRIRSLVHTTIGKQFYIKNGFPWNSRKFLLDNSGEPVIRIRDVKPNYIDNKKLTSIEKKYADSIGFPKANAGDVVIGMDGLKYFYASILEDDCLVNQRVCHICPKENSKISSEYVTFIINSKIGQAQIMRDMTIATTVGHITNMNVSKLIIPIVSDEFQKAITDLVRKSIDADKQSKQLLQEAKTRVEELIEAAALKT